MRKKAAISRQNDGKDTAGAAVPAETPDAAAGAAGEEKPAFNQLQYQNDYIRQKYDRINLTMPKGKKEQIRLQAAARGMSVNNFINYLFDRYIEGQEVVTEAIKDGYTPFETEEEHETRILYGMRLRGFSIGCQPMDGFVERIDDATGKYHDIIIYNRELSEKEIADFELDRIGKAGAAK